MGADVAEAGAGAAPGGVRWTSKVGAWLGIGTAPAALVLGAQLAARHDGAIPLLGVLAGGTVMAALLYAQGLLGVVPPVGEGGTLSEVARGYLGRRSRAAVNLLLAAAMAGWFGFNVGLGGAALGALVGAEAPWGQVLLGVPIVLVSFGGIARWNAVAVVTTASALALVAVVVARLAAPTVPVTPAVDAASLVLADVAGFIGYAAVFSVRAPDFSAGLRRRRDLAWCVGMLVVPTIGVALAGVGLQMGTGRTDPAAALAGPGGLAAGNLLIAVAMIAPSLTTTYSGSLALGAVLPVAARPAMVMIAVPGLALAAIRFDRWLLSWLVVLAAILPPLIVPMAAEATRRRRGRSSRRVPLWTWVPGSALAIGLTIAGVPFAAVGGLAVAGIATTLWSWHGLRR